MDWSRELKTKIELYSEVNILFSRPPERLQMALVCALHRRSYNRPEN